jgi:hypothetical protein
LPRPGVEGYSGGVFFLALRPDGTVLSNPQQVSTTDLPWPQTREPTFATIQLGDGDNARVVLRRMPDGGLLVTGQSLEPEETALHTLLLVLVGGGGLGLLLSLAAAWFLSGRALIPIQQAFQRQQEFVADASHELGNRPDERSPRPAAGAERRAVRRRAGGDCPHGAPRAGPPDAGSV